MKQLLGLAAGFIFISLVACDKNTEFDAQGGDLPTNYIRYRDNAFAPNVLDIANGSSITFLNQTSEAITVKGDDTTILKSVVILPNASFFLKPDTLAAPPATISIAYFCVERPASRGSIILRP